jgi:hypothetical protein
MKPRLLCEQRGLWSDHKARGWAAVIREDPEGDEQRSGYMFCPDRAAKEFGNPI